MALFGTDGVRGVANTELTCEMAFRLGQAAVEFAGSTILIGRDTRKSGDMLEAAIITGITSKGGTALLAGIIPTPGIALLVRELACNGGIVISASHNPPEYNGIKFFDSQGYKLSDDAEIRIEEYVLAGGTPAKELPTGDGVGIAIAIEDACDRYIAHAVKSVTDQEINFEGLSIALDVGYGASAFTSPQALEQLGAKVTVINEAFDGNNINVGCGSTFLDPLIKLVEEVDADVGIAHDGDADRVMLVSKSGRVLDGDIVEAVCAVDLKQQGKLIGNKVVSTVMCNLGFTHAMRETGIEVVQTQVGDRYVLEAMKEQGLIIGGEQSGHMIFLEHNSTGDGLVTACQFLAACVRQGKTPDELANVMQVFPQTLINVRVADKEALKDNVSVWKAVEKAEEKLGDAGRVLVRPSGTEPLVRIMIEAQETAMAESLAQEIAAVIESELA